MCVSDRLLLEFATSPIPRKLKLLIQLCIWNAIALLLGTILIQLRSPSERAGTPSLCRQSRDWIDKPRRRQQFSIQNLALRFQCTKGAT
ncbi:hypothetical protein [Nostoc sp.]|uniref:hypothetical protein n=1 Tax=Nostoc sp. TaxID=1180 RepID=UPI002FF5B625